MINRKKSSVRTLLSLIGLIAACIGLNIAGIKINEILGTPMFFDNVGTLMSAMLGGYVPCITVGFLTNIIMGIGDSFNAYFCIISVFISAAAVMFAERKKLTRFPYILLAAFTFAVIGGIGGGLLTWLINGFDFGEGFAAEFAEKISVNLHTNKFIANLISNFLIDLADKLIVTIVAVLLYKLVPKRLIAYLNTKSWSRLMVFEKNKKKTGRRFSIKIKVTLLVVLFNTLVAASAIVVCVMQYHNSAVKSYSNEGREAATLIAETIDETKINDFIKNGRAAKGYKETESTLYAISNSSNEIKYIYIYRVEEDGTRVIFDLDTAEVEADEPGTIIPYDDTIKKYRGKFLSGEDVPDDITTNDDGWLLSVYEPVKDANGKTLCYIGIDMSMQLLSSEEYSFLAKIISLFLGFLIVIRTYAVWMSELWIIRPLNEITSAASRISYDTPEARRDSAKMLSDLNVSTGDEIEDLYNAYKKTSFDTIRYINEFQKKSGQLTKMQNGLIMVLADMVESRDKCTGDHVRKTAAYTEIILRQMKKEGIHADMLSEEYITEVVNSAPLHDVGKIKIPDAILNKPGRLTDEEFKRIQNHTTAGGEVIDKAIALVDDETGYLTEAKKLATYHHEKWNGKGYPTGLSGEDIPLSARVMAVADVFDALVSRRSYKEPFPFDKAVDIIRNDAGTHFDPVVVKAFLDAEDEIKRVYAINMDI